jgi:hypothetical protein
MPYKIITVGDDVQFKRVKTKISSEHEGSATRKGGFWGHSTNPVPLMQTFLGHVVHCSDLAAEMLIAETSDL